MAAPSPPSTGPPLGTGTDVEFVLSLELSLAQLATLDAAFDAKIELTGTVTPPTFANAQRVTVSRQVPVEAVV